MKKLSDALGLFCLCTGFYFMYLMLNEYELYVFMIALGKDADYFLFATIILTSGVPAVLFFIQNEHFINEHARSIYGCIIMVCLLVGSLVTVTSWVYLGWVTDIFLQVHFGWLFAVAMLGVSFFLGLPTCAWIQFSQEKIAAKDKG